MKKNNKLEEFAVKRFYESELMKGYNKKRFRTAVELSDVKPTQKVLDFGCYNKVLKKYLPNVVYYGYDINPKFRTINKWKDLQGINIVFALDVLEHMDKIELNKIIKQFKKMGIKKLVTSFPFEDSWINKFGSYLTGAVFENHLTHDLTWRSIAKVLNDHYECIDYKSIYWITWVSVWELRE